MNHKKTPKQSRKHYHRGYNNGFRAGQLKAAGGMVDKFRKAYPKVSKFHEGVDTGAETATAAHMTQHNPYERDAIRWEAAMTLLDKIGRMHG